MDMRLLEFNLDAGGANPQSHASTQPPSKKVARPVKLAKPAAATARSGKLFPLNAGETPAIPRKPIDLEHLQQRIELLERRILARAETGAEHPASRDLELIKQRVARLQQSVHSELWAARQREHTMLQLLSKPSFKTALKQRIELLWRQQLPAAARWLVASAQQWWRGCQPDWWSAFAHAWQDSLNKARGLPRN
jgi:hypothetical protein